MVLSLQTDGDFEMSQVKYNKKWRESVKAKQITFLLKNDELDLASQLKDKETLNSLAKKLLTDELTARLNSIHNKVIILD